MNGIREKSEGAAVLFETPVPLTAILSIAQELDLNFTGLKFSHMASNLQKKLQKFHPVKI